MNLTDAAHMARTLMNTHGLNGVRFEFDRGRRRLGACHYRNGKVDKITLSHHYANLLPKEEIEQTILHEIAHAKAFMLYGERGHGTGWKREARNLGLKGSRCATPSEKPEAAWTAHCKNGHENRTKFHRAPLRIRSCSQCDPKFNVAYLIEWRKDGVKVPTKQMPARYQREMYSVLMGK